MSSDLTRISITMPEELLATLDDYASRRGIAKNRSEVVRDLVRDALVKEKTEESDAFIFATLTMVFDHHTNDLRDKLDDIQHAHFDEIISSMHVHVDEHNCLETIVMKGRSSVLRGIADSLLGTKGVLNGDLIVTVVGDGHADGAHGGAAGAHSHANGEHAACSHAHPHTHSHEHHCHHHHCENSK